jgi:threonine/homoserine/homoserine lactone efflux protein
VHGDVLTFLGIIVVLTITPGADMALIMRHVLAHGRGAIAPTLAGVFTGVLVHASLCIAGLSVVLRRSDIAFDIVKFSGAAWLVYLGAAALWSARRPSGEAVDGTDPDAAPGTAPARQVRPVARWTLYRRGLLTNLLNVKIALFYIAFLPQFAPAGDRFVPVAIALTLVQAAIGAAWLAAYGLFIWRVGTALDANPRARRWLEGTTGAALVGLGVRLAAVSR